MKDSGRIYFWLRLATILLLAAFPSRAQDDWVQKPFEQWSKKEAEQVLNASPWVRKQEVRLKYSSQERPVAGAGARAQSTVIFKGGEPVLVQGSNTTANVGGAEAPIDFEFTLRLRSGLPVRQAFMRLKQIEAKYDQMNEAQKAAFNEKNRGLLECPACRMNYVVSLSCHSKNSPGADAVYATLKGAQLEDLKRYVYLANEKGERHYLIHFTPPKAPGEEAYFFFPRLGEREEVLLTPENKEILFNLTKDDVNTVVNFRIPLAPLIANGAVQF